MMKVLVRIPLSSDKNNYKKKKKMEEIENILLSFFKWILRNFWDELKESPENL